MKTRFSEGNNTIINSWTAGDMIYPTSSTSPDLLIRRPDDDRRTGLQNEGWDINLFRVGAAEAAVSPSNVDALHHTDAAAEAASPLDDFLSGGHHKYPFGFTLSIPSSNGNGNGQQHKLSSPAAKPKPSEYKQKDDEEGSCDESSLVSELTQMTYRADLLKQAIMIEFEKFRQQKKQQGVETNPEAMKTMFHRRMSCPDIQKSMTSFINTTSVKMKAEARQHHHQLDEVAEEEHDDISHPTMQRRVDELFVDFGVRPERSIPCETPEENSMRSRPSTEQRAATDHHPDLDAIIQLKLELAQKQATLDEVSSKYNALLVQKSAQHNILAENSCLRRENELLRAQLRQAGIASAAPRGHQLLKSPPPFDLADSHDRRTPPTPSRPSHTFNIHNVLQDRLTSARVVDTKKVDATNKAYQTPSQHQEFQSSVQEFQSFRTTSMGANTRSATNESPPLQPSLKPLNSFSNIIQCWRNRPTTTTESSGELLHRCPSMPTGVVSTKPSDTSQSQRRREGDRAWTRGD